MRRKGELVVKTLKVIGDVALTTADIIAVLATSRYGASYTDLSRKLSDVQKERRTRAVTREDKRRFYDLMYRLRRDGLVATMRHSQEGKKQIWRLTAKGKNFVKDYEKEPQYFLPQRLYQRVPSEELKIIIFDIPEVQRRKRKWLRQMLVMLGFTMLQRSVWVGKANIPQDFLDDLFNLQLIPYVEVFAVAKAGTLKSVITRR